MTLPKAIQRQADEAAAQEQALQQRTAQAPELVTDPAKLPANEPAPPQPSEPAQPAATPAPTPKPDDSLEQKYKTLQGMYNSQVPQLQRALKAAQDQYTTVSQTVEELKARLDKPSKPQDKPAADPKDVENFGADLVDMVNRQAERIYAAMVSQFNDSVTSFDARLKAVEQSVTGVSQKADTTLEQQFYAALSGLVPDWETVNSDERWLAWLSEVDPIYGVPRQSALDAAHKAMDPRRVANVFNAYKTQHPPKAAQSMSNQVTPSGAAAPAPTAAPAKPILSEKFITKFYQDVALSRYAGRDKEMQRIEAEINSAIAEGRVR